MARDPRSVLSRPAPPPDLTLRYGEHPEHVADVRLPRSGMPGAPVALVLFVHGGFWRQAYDRSHTGPLAAALAGLGFVVITPEYRRTGGDGGWPATVDDVAAAVNRLPSLVRDRLGAGAVPTSTKLVLAGHSAGGQLALWAAASGAAAEPAAGVVALAPVADLRAAYDLDLDAGAVRELLGGGPDQVPLRYAAVNPMDRLPVGAHVEIVHGLRDLQVPVELSRRFAAAARSAGDDVSVQHPDSDHFAVIDPDSRVWPVVVTAFQRAADGVGGA